MSIRLEFEIIEKASKLGKWCIDSAFKRLVVVLIMAFVLLPIVSFLVEFSLITLSLISMSDIDNFAIGIYVTIIGGTAVVFITGIPNKLEEAEKASNKTRFREFNNLANKENADVQCEIARSYEKGLGVEKDIKEAVEWYKKAVKQGHALAKNNLAKIYENYQNRYGIEFINYDKMLKLYFEAAKQDNKYAQHNLGRIYENGITGKKNDYEAFKWYEKALGYPPANRRYGVLKKRDPKEKSMSTELERKLEIQVFERLAKMQILKYNPQYFKNMIMKYGVREAIARLLDNPSTSGGQNRLVRLGRIDLSMEALVVENKEFHSLFTKKQLEQARKWLNDYGYKA